MPYYDFEDLLVAGSQAREEEPSPKLIEQHEDPKKKPVLNIIQSKVFHFPFTTTGTEAFGHSSILLLPAPTVQASMMTIENIQYQHEQSGYDYEYDGEEIPSIEDIWPIDNTYFNLARGGLNPFEYVQNGTKTGHLMAVQTDNPNIYQYAGGGWPITGAEGFGFEDINGESYWTTYDFMIWADLDVDNDADPATGSISLDCNDETKILTFSTVLILDGDTETFDLAIDFSELFNYAETLPAVEGRPEVTATFADFTIEIFARTPSFVGNKHLAWGQNNPIYGTSFYEEYSGEMISEDYFDGSQGQPSVKFGITLPWYVIDRDNWERRPDLRTTVDVPIHKVAANLSGHTPYYDIWADQDVNVYLFSTPTFFKNYNGLDIGYFLLQNHWLSGEKYTITFSGEPLPYKPNDPTYFDTGTCLITERSQALNFPALYYDIYIRWHFYLGCAGMNPIINVNLTTEIINSTQLKWHATTDHPGAVTPYKECSLELGPVLSNFNECSGQFYYLRSYGSPPDLLDAEWTIDENGVEWTIDYDSEMHTTNPIAIPNFGFITLPSSLVYRP